MRWPSDDFVDIQERRFQPYIFILTTSLTPASIAMAAVAGGGMKYINLPESVTLADLRDIQRVVRDHYQEHDGNCMLYGRITGFLFVHTPTEGILLDIEGNPTENGQRTGRFWPQSIQIQKAISST